MDYTLESISDWIDFPHLANDDFHNKIAQDLESYKPPTDYKCHMFNGALSHIEVIRGRFVHREEIRPR